MKNLRQILVIQTAFLGDAVLATGILETLHKTYPDASIDYLVRKGHEPLFQGHPFLRAVLSWDKKAGKYQAASQLLKQIRSTQYDMVVNVQRFAMTGLFTALSGAPIRIGYDKNPLSRFFTHRIPHVISDSRQPIHEIERCHALIAGFTSESPAKPRLYPSASDLEKVKAYTQDQPFITIAPASIWFTKQYPADKWRELIARLPSDMTVYLLGAPSDQSLCATISAGFDSHRVRSLAGQFSFLESAALMKQAKMNFVNDSAPMHFASAVDAPVAAIYCSTLPSFGFGPLSTEQHVIEVEQPLACRPCGLHGQAACPQKHFRCALDIRVEQLLQCL